MKQAFCFFTIVLLLISTLYSQEKKIRLAVSTFDALTREAAERKEGEAGARKIEIQLSNIDHFNVRPSGAIKAYLNRLYLAQTGLIDAKIATRIGKKCGIDYLIVGSVARFGDLVEMDTRTVDLGSWRIIDSFGKSGKNIRGIAIMTCSHMDKKVIPSTIKKLRGEEDKLATISVFHLADSNLQALRSGYGGTMSEILNSELGRHSDIAVFERTHSKALLNEKMMEMIGVVQNNRSSEYFNIRGISYKIEGSLRTFGDLICLSYRVVDTESGQLIYLGYIELATVRALRPVAYHIASEVASLINNRIGTLMITCNKTGPEVRIDGMHYVKMGRKPLMFILEKGEHMLSMELEGYEKIERKITILPKKVLKQRIIMKKKKSPLKYRKKRPRKKVQGTTRPGFVPTL